MENRTIILITGTSRGIGKQLLGSLRQDPKKLVYGSSRKANPKDPYHIPLDVTDAHSCIRAVERIIAEQGRIDVLVNNAGSHLTGASEETSLREIDDQMQINFYGAIHMIKAVTPLMLEQGSGRIINMSSLGGLLALPYTSAYNASKFALEGYTESLRLELLPLSIFVSNLEPAYINSGTVDQSIIAPKKAHPIFSGYRTAMHEKMLIDSKRGIPMEQIVRVIRNIIHSERPKFRYRIGKMTRSLTLLQTLLPESIFQSAVLRSFGIPLKKKTA